MRKTILSILLALCMICTLLPVTAMAIPRNTIVTHIVSSDGKLTSITAKFEWPQSDADATGRLVLMEKYLRSSIEDSTPNHKTYGDLTNLGYYGNTFSNWSAVETYNTADKTKDTFKIIASGTEASITSSSNNIVTLDLSGKNISLSTNKIYYVYLWTYYNSHYYPDALICALQVKDGALQFAPATGRNTYEAFANATFSDEKTTYNVTVNAGANMTIKTGTGFGAATQNSLNQAMTPVVYTADSGYHFESANYSVISNNGIKVRWDSAQQITVYGTPTGNATITLPAATQGNPPSEETPTYGISVSPSSHTFPALTEGYTASELTLLNVSVKNTGNQATGELAVALTGNSDAFESITSITSIASGGSASFTIKPKTGLAVGTYTATVTVSGGNSISETLTVTFTVSEGETTPEPPAEPTHDHTRRQNTTTTTVTTPDTTTVASLKTGDAGIAVYAALSIMSMTGSAWIIGTKRRR